jgi:hypothetical protein
MLSWCLDPDKWLQPCAKCRKLNECTLVNLAPALSRVAAIIVNERHSVVSMASGSARVFSVLLGAETSTRKHDVKIDNGSVSREQHEIRCR